MSKTKITKSFLNLFAKSVRDAETEEEVKEVVNSTQDAVNELEEEKQTVKDAEPDTQQKLLEVLLELSTVIKDLKSGTPVPDAEPVVEEKKEEVISNDEDPSMEKLNELEDACSKDEDAVEEEKATECEDEERPIEEIVESSKEVSDADEDPAVPVESNTFSKIVKDMKPTLAKISNAKERKLVCDALAKTLGQVKKNSVNYSNIMKATQTRQRRVGDSANYLSNDGLQDYYDKLNPHNKQSK